MRQLRILRRPEVEKICGLGHSRIHQLEAQGLFPRRVRISNRAVGWRSDEIEDWLASRPRATEVGVERDEDVGARMRGQGGA